MALDSLSARVLSTPRRCWAFKRMFLSMHHSSLARQFSCGDIPPRLLMYVSVDMLSIFSKMVRLLELTSVLGKAFYCQVSCQELQAVDVHLLFMGAPWTSVPNPIYNSQQTNLFVWTVLCQCKNVCKTCLLKYSWRYHMLLSYLLCMALRCKGSLLGKVSRPRDQLHDTNAVSTYCIWKS